MSNGQRFKRGVRVRVLKTEGSAFAGAEGVVDEVKPNSKNLTELDQYLILFSWGERQAFWSAQLEPAPDDRRRGT